MGSSTVSRKSSVPTDEIEAPSRKSSIIPSAEISVPKKSRKSSTVSRKSSVIPSDEIPAPKKPRKSSTVSRKSSVIPSEEIEISSRKSSIARESLGKNNHSSLDDNEDGSESESSDELLIELSDSS